MPWVRLGTSITIAWLPLREVVQLGPFLLSLDERTEESGIVLHLRGHGSVTVVRLSVLNETEGAR